MDLPTRVYVQSAEVTARLYDLDLKREALVEAVHFGFSYAAECTLHDPKSLAGIVLWGKTVRKLRDQLIPDGWDVENDRTTPLPSIPVNNGHWSSSWRRAHRHP